MLCLMVGVPGSGKSLIAKRLAKMLNAEVISTDEQREKWFGNAEDQSHNKELFQRIDEMVSNMLAEKKNVILDATNVSCKSRRRFVLKGKQFQTDVVAFVVHTSANTAKERNINRDRTVPEFVIDRQLANFQMPSKEEGFSAVFVIDNDNSIF